MGSKDDVCNRPQNGTRSAAQEERYRETGGRWQAEPLRGYV